MLINDIIAFTKQLLLTINRINSLLNDNNITKHRKIFIDTSLVIYDNLTNKYFGNNLLGSDNFYYIVNLQNNSCIVYNHVNFVNFILKKRLVSDIQGFVKSLTNDNVDDQKNNYEIYITPIFIRHMLQKYFSIHNLDYCIKNKDYMKNLYTFKLNLINQNSDYNINVYITDYSYNILSDNVLPIVKLSLVVETNIHDNYDLLNLINENVNSLLKFINFDHINVISIIPYVKEKNNMLLTQFDILLKITTILDLLYIYAIHYIINRHI
ncbi:MAG: hypothetical protein QXW35_05230 [Candidatus Aenigmatarchaeota archaeon]